MQYDTWKDHDGVTYVKRSAEEITDLYAENSVDIVICSGFLHHYITEGFRATSEKVDRLLADIQRILKPGGLLFVTEILCDGFLIDSFPCRMVFKLSSNTNALLRKAMKAIGVKSAGVGVCMQSEKMWRRRFKKAGLKYIFFYSGELWQLNPIKRISLLMKRYRGLSTFVLMK